MWRNSLDSQILIRDWLLEIAATRLIKELGDFRVVNGLIIAFKFLWRELIIGNTLPEI